MAATGVNLAGYQILEQVYAGRRTLIYRAWQESTQSTVMIKLLQNEHPDFTELAQFRNQYTIAKHLELPEVIQTLALEPYQNAYALVMEDFDGISLKAEAARWGDRGMGSTIDGLIAFLEIALQVTTALDGIYRQRVIHKDIKPANILINPNTRQVKLIDFSISSLLPRETQVPVNPNVLEGTLAYLSPEQTGRMNRGVDYRTDFYSLGVTFYELLTGQLPFQSSDSMELIHCHLAKQPPAIASLIPTIPPSLAAIVDKLMAKNAEDRYQSALGLKHDLAHCLIQLQTTGQIDHFPLGRRDCSDRFIISEKLYGRTADVATLMAAYDQVTQGNTEMLLVAGFSGIGKTAIVNEVHKPIARSINLDRAQQHAYFIKGKFDQFQRNIPFSAIVQAFRDLIAQLLKGSNQQIAQWQTAILNAVGDNGQIIIDLIPEVELLIGQQPPVIHLDPIATQNRLQWVLQKFVRVFPSVDHPLVMFLDDLQWADTASLNFIQVLMSETELRYLLLIGAYRDNEVNPVHPLMLTVNEIRKIGTSINTITLPPLSLSDLNELVADTLHCDVAIASPLSQLVFTKTKGNPFFSTQFLKALHESELITFDLAAGCWQWDLEQVRSHSLTDDVVEFMAAQIQKLPALTQTVLQLAACIGNQFELKTLAIVQGASQAETATALWEALQAGLILPIGSGYQFLHDRVQQAAYLLIPDAQKAATHLKIGRLLLSNTPPAEREKNIFAIVNQLNYGVPLISHPAERNELAQLNLIAAQKAIATTVYTAALDYATTGITLLSADSWQQQYAFTLALYEAAVEAASLCGESQQMKQLAATAVQHTRTVLDRINIYASKIQAYTSQNKLLDAIAIARRALGQLAVELPETPEPDAIEAAFQATAALMAGKTIEDLMCLPLMQSPQHLAIVRLAASVIPAAYIAAPNLLPLIVLLQIRLFVQYGNTPLSAFGYANYSLLLKSALQDVEAADQFGKLALQLATKFNAPEIKARTCYVLGAFIVHGKSHVRDTLPLLLEGYQTALECGKLEFVGYCAKEICNHSYFAGDALAALEREMKAYSHTLANLKQTTSLTYCQIYWQTTLNLLGQADDRCTLSGEALDEDTVLPSLLEANDISGLHYFYLNKLILCYLFEDIPQAIDVAAKAAAYLAGGTGFITVPVFHFYDALVALAADSSQVDEADRLRDRITNNQAVLQQWAYYAPMNYQHKYYLVEAERQRVLGEKVAAMECYDQAIELANAHGYVNEAAIAGELAAKFYLVWGKTTIAQTYLLNAYHAYERWGAKAKLDDLLQRYPDALAAVLQPSLLPKPPLLPPVAAIAPPHMDTTNSSSTSISEALDLATALKASQALSGEIQLEKLLITLMQVVIENAGAQTGALLLRQADEFVIQAQAVRRDGEENLQITALQSRPLQACQDLPITLINYSSRTSKTLVIDDATTDAIVADDPYILRCQPRSILCTPLRKQGTLIGILYLENNLTRGAFTRDRLQILKLLTTQAAISLENALLYENLASANAQLEGYNDTLEQKVADRTQELHQKTQNLEQTVAELQRTQTQLIQAEKMSSLGQMIAGIAHEINNPINFIHGNIGHTNEYVQNLFELVATYQRVYPRPNADVTAMMQEIELDFLMQDLPKLLHSMKVGSDRIRNIILSLRNFSRLDEAEMKPVDIHEGIDSTLLILQHRLKAKSDGAAIEVVRQYGNLPKVDCYAGQLNQVFMNILSNAIDALDAASRQSDAAVPAPHIRICTDVIDADWVEIRIADNGPGMPEAVKQKIFDPFFTTKPIGSGTGLGLSISYQIVVDKHLGRLSCHSTPGQGTEFIVAVPISGPHQTPALHANALNYAYRSGCGHNAR